MITIWKVRALLNQRGVTADEDKDFRLQDNADGAGPFIAAWDVPKLGAEPTEAELDAFQTEADALKQGGVDRAKMLAAVLDLGFIVVRLADVLVAKAVISPADFDGETRQAYQTLKAIVDRLRP